MFGASLLGRNLNHLVATVPLPLSTFGPATIVQDEPPSHICANAALRPRVLGYAEVHPRIDATAAIAPRVQGQGAINHCDCD